MSERERLLQTLSEELDRLAREPQREPTRLRELVGEQPIEVAEALDDLDEEQVVALFDRLEMEVQAGLIEEASEPVQDLLLDHLKGDERRPAILEEMAPDDVADIIDDMPAAEVAEVLDGLHTDRAEQIRELARYAADTAGGLMTPEFLGVAESDTVQVVKSLIRGEERYETIDNIYVVRDDKLVGVFSARQLLRADNAESVDTFMTKEVISVDVDDDAEECFRVMEGHHLSSVPVVDAYHKLVGMVTFDDVFTAAEEEASEDVFKIAGSGDVHPTRDSVLGRVRKRIPYLLISVFGGFGSAAVMKLMGHEEVADLVFFLPMVLMLGGNIAQQSSAVMVRGFATGEVEAGRVARVVRDELLVGILASILCAGLGGWMAYTLGTGSPWGLARVVAITIPLLALISSLLGTCVPTAFHKLNMDPAIGAGPMITMLIDLIGCALYISLSRAV